MSAVTATIERMGKKKGGNGGKPPKRSPAYTVFARLSVELGGALDAYIASLRPRPTLTSVLEVFIEEGLKRVGFWPPKEGGD